MNNVLLIDFGSTYTKLTAVDVDNEKILGTANAYTTVETDINDGLSDALRLLEEQTGKMQYNSCYACSSAAGGLRMVTSGLVSELTGEAAKQASLGAGAKVVGVYSFELTDSDIEEIKNSRPDIFLLVGGTDGGNRECIIKNAEKISQMDPDFPIIIAGNRNAADECKRILENCEVYVCPNVMPKLGSLNTKPTQNTIRQIFLNKIIYAKGLSKVGEILSDIMMPTPSAVMQAIELLADGCEGESGIGELVAVDVGGATTDVYSVAEGMPEHMNTVYKGLPEPYSKRSVEGDIGMRYSVRGIVECAGMERICELSGLDKQKAEDMIDSLCKNPAKLPDGDRDYEMLDFALASCAVDEAVSRHAGTISETYTMMGLTYVQEGKNLGNVKNIVVTGGSLVHTKNTEKIAGQAMYSPRRYNSLKPKQADVLVDRKYILAAMGLLSKHYPQTALRIMKKEFEHYGHSE